MALPTSRNTTYAGSSQVKSADLNDIQDQIIADHTDLVAAESRLYGTRSEWIHGCAGQLSAHSSSFVCTDAGFVDVSSGGILNYSIEIPEGARLLDVRARILTSANAGSRSAEMFSMPFSTGTPASLQAASTSASTSSLITLTPIVGNDYTFAGDTVYVCRVTFLTGDLIKMIGIDWDWP